MTSCIHGFAQSCVHWSRTLDNLVCTTNVSRSTHETNRISPYTRMAVHCKGSRHLHNPSHIEFQNRFRSIGHTTCLFFLLGKRLLGHSEKHILQNSYRHPCHTESFVCSNPAMCRMTTDKGPHVVGVGVFPVQVHPKSKRLHPRSLESISPHSPN